MWLPEPETASIVSSHGEVISCSDPRMTEMFCSTLEALDRLERDVLSRCEKWKE